MLIALLLFALLAVLTALWWVGASKMHYVVVLLVPCLAIAGYVHWGAYPAVVAAKTFTQYRAQISTTRAQQGVSGLITLTPHLPLHPSALWTYLGESYLEENRADLAVPAYEQAIRAAESAPAAMDDRLALVNAYFVRDQGHISTEMDAQIQTILTLDPHNPAALNLRAIGAFEKGFYAAAIEDWRALRQEIPDWSLQTHVLQAIAKAQSLENDQQSAEAQIPVIQVTVALSDEAQSQITPASLLFVTLHLTELPQMPWAAVKIPIENLPMIIRFSEDLALQPTYPLVTGQPVVIKARFSPQGEQVGSNMEWVALPQMRYITGTNQSVSLTIDRRRISDDE